MKKIALILAIVMLFTFTMAGCGSVRGVEIDYGTSQIYTVDNMKDAISSIFSSFSLFYEGKLVSLTYAGDEFCKGEFAKEYFEQDHYHSHISGDVYHIKEIMVFYSDIKENKYDNNGNVYYKDKKVTWILGRKDNYKWETIDWMKTKQ